MVHQERQKKVFCISFTIFATVYTIIFAFIGATFEFIRIMATVPAKGLPGMLGPFYDDGEGAEKGEESKQPVEPQSSPEPGDAIPTPTPATSGADDPQQKEDKGHEVHLPVPGEAVGPPPPTGPPMERDKVYVMAQPMPAPGTPGTPYFTGQNVSQFIEQYERLCVRHHVTDNEKHQGLPEYCDYWIGTWIRSLPEFAIGNWMELVRKLRTDYRGSDYFRQVETVEFLEAYVLQCRNNPPSSIREYCRQFTLISQKVTEAGNLENRERGYWFARGLPFEYRRHAMTKTGADPDRRESFNFHLLRRAVEDRLNSHEGADRLSIMNPEEQGLRQLVGQFRDQQPAVTSQRDAALRPPVVSQLGESASTRRTTQETDPELEKLTDQLRKLNLGTVELAGVASSMPFLDRIRQDPIRYTQLLNRASMRQEQMGPQPALNNNRPQPPYEGAPRERYEPGSGRYRGPGNFGAYQAQAQTCYGCGGSHRFIDQCPQLQELIRRGFLHVNENNRICAGTRERPGNTIPYLPSDNRIQFLKDWLRQNANIDPDAPVTGVQPKAASVELVESSDAESEEELGESWEDVYQVESICVDSVGAATQSQPVLRSYNLRRPQGEVRVTKQPSGQRPATVRNVRPGGHVQIAPRPQQQALQPPSSSDEVDEMNHTEQPRQTEQIADATTTAKAPRSKPVRMMDILKGNVPSPTVMADKILSKTIEVTVGDCLVYMPEVARLFFKPLPPPLAEPYRQKQEDVKASVSSAHLTFHADQAGLTTAEVDQIEREAGFVRFRRRCPKVEAQIGDGRAKCLIDSGAELNLIRESVALRHGLPISSLPPQLQGARLTSANGTQSEFIGLVHAVPVVIGDVSISTTFIAVGEMSHEVILGEPWSVRARLATKRTATGQVSCIIQSEDGRVETRFLTSHEDAMFFRPDEGISMDNSSGNV